MVRDVYKNHIKIVHGEYKLQYFKPIKQAYNKYT